MGTLMVITVPPEALRDPTNENYEVILGDCVLPGHCLGQYPTIELANEACERFAQHYRLQAYPYTPLTPAQARRLAFTVIKGGID